MRLKVFACLLLLLSIAQDVSGQTAPACDDLCTALVKHGMDAGTAPIAAAALEWGISNQNSYITRLAADELLITTLQKQVAALTPITPPPTPVLQIAADKATSSVPTLYAYSTSDSGSLDGQKVQVVAGQVLVYNLVATGTYSPFARLCNAQGSTSAMTAHFEITPGVMVGSELTLAAGVQWTVVSSGASVPLTGSFLLRLVIDTVAAGGGSFVDIVGIQ